MADFPNGIQYLSHGSVDWDRREKRPTKRQPRGIVRVVVTCGDCGAERWIVPADIRRARGEPTGRCAACSNQELAKHLKTGPGRQHSRFKGMRRLNWHGYYEVAVYPGDPWYEEMGTNGRHGHVRYIAEHRQIIANKLGRALLPWEHVHHLDGDKGNNAPENLELVSASDHAVITRLQTENESLKAEVLGLQQALAALQRPQGA